jgi:hypothetical protein
MAVLGVDAGFYAYFTPKLERIVAKTRIQQAATAIKYIAILNAATKPEYTTSPQWLDFRLAPDLQITAKVGAQLERFHGQS